MIVVAAQGLTHIHHATDSGVCMQCYAGNGKRRGGSVRRQLIHASNGIGTPGPRGQATRAALALLLIQLLVLPQAGHIKNHLLAMQSSI